MQVQPSNCVNVNLVSEPLKVTGVTSIDSEPLFVKILYSPTVVPFAKLSVNVPPEFLLPITNVPLTIDAALVSTVTELKAALLKLTEPVPFALRSKLMLVTAPVEVIEGAFDPAAFAIVISFCALVVAVSLIISAPLASLIKVPILGEFIIGDVNSTSVSEHTIALILNLAKKINYYDSQVRLDNFNVRNTFQSRDLSGKKILIYGYGRIGKKVAQLCKFFNMEVSIYDKFLSLDKIPNTFKVLKNIEENLDIFDFITLHVPYNNSGKSLIDKSFLNKLNKECSIINTSRGDLINENDLLDHLKKNKNFNAGLDVFNPEPPSKNNELLKLDNVVLTPHSAAYTEECLAEMSMYCAKNINDFFNNKMNKSLLVNKDIYS